jgi:hypothetical protein
MSKSDQAVSASRIIDEAALESAVHEGIIETPPMFNTHSVALAGKMEAEAAAYRAQVADVDAKIKLLQAERTDLMLAYSMLSAAMTAREKGQ